MLRYRVTMETRRYLDTLGFIDIETPMLTKSTPEGARDYLVPSRVNAGMFFALAAVAAVVQAAADGRRFRSLLPDREVLPRRGPARRPAAGVHADRLRDLVPRRAGDPGHLRGDGANHLPQRARRQPAGPVPDDELPGRDPSLRLGQAGHAGAAAADRTDRRDEGSRVQGLLRSGAHGEGAGGSPAGAGRRRHDAQRDRRLHAVRRHLRRARARLHQGQRRLQGARRAAIPDRQEPARRGARRDPAAHRGGRRRPALLRGGHRQGGQRRHGCPAQQDRAFRIRQGPRPARKRMAATLGGGLSDVRV